MKIKALFTFHFSENKMKKLEELSFKIILKNGRILKYLEELKNAEFIKDYFIRDCIQIQIQENLYENSIRV